MIVKTDAYGDIEYQEKDLITFPDGIFGFNDLKQYLLLSLSEEDDTMLLMLAVERPEIIFAIVNPVILCNDYAPELTPAELSFLNAENSEELSYYTICNIHTEKGYQHSTVNLKCPLVIDPVTRRGMQVILSNPSYQYRHKFGSFITETEEADMQNEEEQDVNHTTQEE